MSKELAFDKVMIPNINNIKKSEITNKCVISDSYIYNHYMIYCCNLNRLTKFLRICACPDNSSLAAADSSAVAEFV